MSAFTRRGYNPLAFILTLLATPAATLINNLALPYQLQELATYYQLTDPDLSRLSVSPSPSVSSSLYFQSFYHLSSVLSITTILHLTITHFINCSRTRYHLLSHTSLSILHATLPVLTRKSRSRQRHICSQLTASFQHQHFGNHLQSQHDVPLYRRSLLSPPNP